ncbi:MAG: hypothetical protein M0R70_09985 [Nitrospirae bacterium]|nr:hypothetical protein [Nitrospirota bacterium]
MTDNVPLEQTLCLKFCSYYEPGKNEELACKGYRVVERLLREGKGLVLESNNGESSPVLADRIVKTLCIVCDFYKQDCDFMQDRTARPCGGFVLLERLLGSGVITIEDIG